VAFSLFEVDLASGITITAYRPKSDILESIQLSVLKGNDVLARWDYLSGSKSSLQVHDSGQYYVVVDTDTISGENIHRFVKKEKKKSPELFPEGEDIFLKTLKTYVPTMFILNADRRLDSDSVPDPSDEMELRRVMRYEEPKHINDLVARSREIALSQAMGAAGSWVSKKALQGANQGSMNVHSVYVDVLQHVIKPSSEKLDGMTKSDIGSLIKRLTAIEDKTTALARYELATELSISELYKALKSRSVTSSSLAAELLKPYIASLEGRLNAVEPVYHIVDRFVSIVNGFLSDKSLIFKLSQGFKVQNRLGAILSPAQLSSGEQQLLLLFYYVLTCRDNPSIFMIDEPEISLNIKWQRRLVQSLLDITAGASIQFVFASHSMELLAQHRNRVVRLVNTK